MTADLARLTALDRPTVPVTPGGAGTGAVAPSRALTRLLPVDPHDAAPTQPLGRSGLDLADLLAVTDQVASREATGSVAREVGLEHARGSLLRNQPGAALASLDGIWDGARHSEEGWYLRSGALSALGLPGESERVAHEGLALRPTSMALRFMQSFTRMTLGDFPGARAALQPALQRAPADPLLLVQRALVQAKQGDPRGADTALRELATAAPEHPAVVWGRSMLRTIAADAARQRARPTPVGSTSVPVDHGEHVPARDASATALERFGGRLATQAPTDTIRDARMLMRAFSAGGTLASAVTAEHAHAARMVLAAILGVATGEGAEVPGPLRALVQTLVPMVQQGRADDAERVLRRQGLTLREPMGRLLLAVIRGGLSAAPVPAATVPAATADGAEAPSVSGSVVRGASLHAETVRDDADRGHLVPVRLGLGLLEETPASRVALDPTRSAWTATGLPFGVRDDGTVVRYMMSGDMRAVSGPSPDAELAGVGWGAAQAAGQSVPGARPDGLGVGWGAAVLAVLAVGAIVTGHGWVALALGVGAAWWALHRRRGGDDDGADARAPDVREGAWTHEPGSSQ